MGPKYKVEEPANLDITKPIAIVIGWMGSTERPLSKYTALLHELGCPTIATTSSTYQTFFNPRGNQPRAKLLMRCALEYMDKTGREVPVVFYALSNGGCFVYAAILQILENASGGKQNALWQRFR